MMTDLEWNREFALEQMGDDEDFLAEMLKLHQQTSITDLEKIKQAIQAGNKDAAREAAHSIKGASANLGLVAMQRTAEEMESASRDGNLDVTEGKITLMGEMIGLIDQLQ